MLAFILSVICKTRPTVFVQNQQEGVGVGVGGGNYYPNQQTSLVRHRTQQQRSESPVINITMVHVMFIYFVFTCMTDDSNWRQFKPLLLCPFLSVLITRVYLGHFNTCFVCQN